MCVSSHRHFPTEERVEDEDIYNHLEDLIEYVSSSNTNVSTSCRFKTKEHFADEGSICSLGVDWKAATSSTAPSVRSAPRPPHSFFSVYHKLCGTGLSSFVIQDPFSARFCRFLLNNRFYFNYFETLQLVLSRSS